MPSARTNLFTRPDTMFGVCQGLGEDFGFNPNYLRLTLPLPLFLYPVATIAGYLAVGLIVLIVHWLIPNRPVREAEVETDNEVLGTGFVAAEEPLPLAA